MSLLTKLYAGEITKQEYADAAFAALIEQGRFGWLDDEDRCVYSYGGSCCVIGITMDDAQKKIAADKTYSADRIAQLLRLETDSYDLADFLVALQRVHDSAACFASSDKTPVSLAKMKQLIRTAWITADDPRFRQLLDTIVLPPVLAA